MISMQLIIYTNKRIFEDITLYYRLGSTSEMMWIFVTLIQRIHTNKFENVQILCSSE